MTPPLSYKDYLGSVDVDIDGGFVFGKLLFIRDVVSYRSDTIAGIRAAFEAAVDEYLGTCRELGESPDLPLKGTFNVRVGPQIHRDSALAAERSDMSLNEWVKRACQLALDRGQDRSRPHLSERENETAEPEVIKMPASGGHRRVASGTAARSRRIGEVH